MKLPWYSHSKVGCLVIVSSLDSATV